MVLPAQGAPTLAQSDFLFSLKTGLMRAGGGYRLTT
jgi:hypothetical protein